MTQLNRRHFLKLIGASSMAAGTGLWLPGIVHAKPKAHVIVVGGGFGGATCANYIRRYSPDIKVTLIEPDKNFITCPFSNMVLAGLKTMNFITHEYDNLKQKRDIKIVHDTVTNIDATKQKIKLKTGKPLKYDRLVVSPGVDFRWGAINGYTQAVASTMPHAWKAGAQTTLLKKQLQDMKDGGKVIIALPEKPFRAPPAPYERASLIAYYFKKNKPKSKILVLDSGKETPEIELFKAGWKKLYPNMIEWVAGNKKGAISAVNSKKMTVKTSGGETVKGDVINVIPPQKAGLIAQTAGLANKNGWCPVDPHTFESTKHKNIYVIGDSSIAGDMPKTAHSANSQAKVCAAAVVLAIRGEKMIDPPLSSAIYSILGPKYAISSAAVYRVKNKKITRVSGGRSDKGASKKTRLKQARFAQGWYKSIVADMFSG